MDPLRVYALWWFFKVRDVSELFDSDTAEVKGAEFSEFIESQRRRISAVGARIITVKDDGYPALLREMPYPPPVIFCLGDCEVLKDRMFSVVGTRRMTEHAGRLALEFSRRLAEHFTVVSGMAYGVDSKAHIGAMESGKTVAVLASGVDIPSPRGNTGLYRDILKKGCVISVYPMGSEATKYRFPERNALIAGLSVGTLVVQAPLKSGALITARWASELGRDVFSIPGDVGRGVNEGTNWLIKSGAIPVTRPDDILDYYGVKVDGNPEHEHPIIGLVESGIDTVEEIAAVTGKPIREILKEVSELELNGKLFNDGGILRILR